MPQWSSSITDAFVAPGLIDFRSAEIPDLSDRFPGAPHWVADHFLNSTLRGAFADGMRQLAMGFLRRARSGFQAYHGARTKTLSYLSDLRPLSQPLGRYFDAVDEWEQFVLQLQMTMDVYRRMPGSHGAFEKGDGSAENRLYQLANMVKHPGRVNAVGENAPIDSFPLWLSNHGLHSSKTSVTFAEAASVLEDVGRFAETLKDPISMRERSNGDDAG
jgi:hypothetical protein